MAIITIKNIEHQQKTSQNGKAYTSCRITVWNKQENKDTFISGFGSGVTKTWNVGDQVDVNLTKTDKGYWNFEENGNSKPSVSPTVRLLEEISAKLDIIIGKGVDTQQVAKEFHKDDVSVEDCEKAFGEKFKGTTPDDIPVPDFLK